MQSPVLSTLYALVMLCSGCEEFDTPAELTRHQVIAVKAVAPSIEPGQTSDLSVTVAGPMGVEAAQSVTWEVVGTAPGVAPIGTITPMAGQTATYNAPSSIDDDPTFAAVQVTTETPSGTITALKAMTISTLVTLENPTITKVTAGDTDITGGWSYTPGETVAISVETNPAATDEFTYAWYTTAGEIEFYQSAPTDIVMPDPAVNGRLIIVVRDGRGGIDFVEIETNGQ